MPADGGSGGAKAPPLAALIDRGNDLIGKAASWLLLFMTATLGVVILLARFDTGFVWLQDLLVYLHGIAFMSAAAYTLLHDGHVRIDLFYTRLTPYGKAVVDALGVALLLFPSCAAIFFYSFRYVAESWRIFEAAQVAGGVPATFALKSFIWVYVLLMSLQGLSLLLMSLAAIARHKADKGREG